MVWPRWVKGKTPDAPRPLKPLAVAGRAVGGIVGNAGLPHDEAIRQGPTRSCLVLVGDVGDHALVVALVGQQVEGLTADGNIAGRPGGGV